MTIDQHVPYPWLAGPWQQLQKAMQSEQLAHAWLLTGSVGLGKRELAWAVAKNVLCVDKIDGQYACGQCASCAQLNSGAHPDFIHLTLPDDRQSIPIDSVRQMNNRLSLTKSTSPWSVAIIEPAEAMNRNAANALLKTLEEPTPNTLMLLVTEQPAQLLATIRSRCVQLRCLAPDMASAKTWLSEAQPSLAEQAEVALQYAAGAPLQAASYAETDFLTRRNRFLQALHQLITERQTAVAVASEFKDEPLNDIQAWASHWVTDLLHLQQQTAHTITNADFKQNLSTLSQNIETRKLHSFYQQLTKFAEHKLSNAQPQLLLENLLTHLQM